MIQIILLFIQQSVMLGIITHYRPMVHKIINYLVLFNESLLTTCILSIAFQTDLVLEQDQQVVMGYSFIGLIGVISIFNLGLILPKSIHMLILVIKKYYYRTKDYIATTLMEWEFKRKHISLVNKEEIQSKVRQINEKQINYVLEPYNSQADIK